MNPNWPSHPIMTQVPSSRGQHVRMTSLFRGLQQKPFLKGGEDCPHPHRFQVNPFLIAPSFLIFMLLPSGDTLHANLCLPRAHARAQTCNSSSCWGCGQVPMFSSSGDLFSHWFGAWGCWRKRPLLELFIFIVIALSFPLHGFVLLFGLRLQCG